MNKESLLTIFSIEDNSIDIHTTCVWYRNIKITLTDACCISQIFKAHLS